MSVIYPASRVRVHIQTLTCESGNVAKDIFTHMNHIPKPLNDEINDDPFYQVCCVTGLRTGKIERHHNLIYAGKQVQEKFAVLPIMEYIHKRADLTHVKDILDWIMLNRASNEELDRYSKAINLREKRNRLNLRFHRIWKEGDYTFHNI